VVPIVEVALKWFKFKGSLFLLKTLCLIDKKKKVKNILSKIITGKSHLDMNLDVLHALLTCIFILVLQQFCAREELSFLWKYICQKVCKLPIFLLTLNGDIFLMQILNFTLASNPFWFMENLAFYSQAFSCVVWGIFALYLVKKMYYHNL